MYKYIPNAVPLTPLQALSTQVEHRSVKSFADCELNVFETHTVADQVMLRFQEPVVASMLRGKKVMHLQGKQPFEFFPGESLILPSDAPMVIDFPEARQGDPTQCIALTISTELIENTVNHFNEALPKCEQGDQWSIDLNQYHLENSAEVTQTLNRLIELSREENQSRDTFARFALHELLLRLMQTQARHLLIDQFALRMSNHRMAYVIHYIKEHLTEAISMDKLSDIACMSKPHFFRSFKRELGISPLEFILRERIKLACRLLTNTNQTVLDIALRCGFNNFNHFAIIFKRFTQFNPSGYRKSKMAIA